MIITTITTSALLKEVYDLDKRPPITCSTESSSSANEGVVKLIKLSVSGFVVRYLQGIKYILACIHPGVPYKSIYSVCVCVWVGGLYCKNNSFLRGEHNNQNLCLRVLIEFTYFNELQEKSIGTM